MRPAARARRRAACERDRVVNQSSSDARVRHAQARRPWSAHSSPLTPHWLQYTGTLCRDERACGRERMAFRIQPASTLTDWSLLPQ